MSYSTLDFVYGCGAQGNLFGGPEPIRIVHKPAGAGPGRPLALTDDVRRLLASNAVASCSISGGKDGTAMALAVARHLDAIGHTGTRLLLHSDLGRVEWKDSLPACERLAKMLGWELVVVRRKAGDMLARWEGRWANNVARYEALECVTLILPWSTPKWRFCTSEFKAALLASELKKRYPQQDILNIVGIRRQESSARSKMPVACLNPALVRRGHVGLNWHPVIEWSLPEVWEEIDASGVTPHEAYTRYGSSRVSCMYCIMSNGADLMAAAGCGDSHDLYRKMVSLEAQSTFGFQGGKWLADVAPDLLDDDLHRRVVHGKAMAVQRKMAEAELPKSLWFVKGRPSAIPTHDEACVLADVRRRVGLALDLEPSYVNANDVRDRYAQMLEATNGNLMEDADETSDVLEDAA